MDTSMLLQSIMIMTECEMNHNDIENFIRYTCVCMTRDNKDIYFLNPNIMYI